MGRAITILFAAALSAFAQRQCATCHADIFAKFKGTGMGRSFFQPGPANEIEDYSRNNHYFHEASKIHYVMAKHDGAYFQKRYQIGLNDEETNAVEERVDYVLGSGNHARTYLHRTQQGTLVQLPLAWYSEKGGYWAMSPGYDTADHPGSRRPIGYDCMFCHNAYPSIPKAKDRFGDVPVFPAELPQGIDCQRCHGPAQNHAVNPAKFSVERRMEVCMQCHLEPDSINPTLDFKRYGKPWFSYQPGQPLADFMVFFDSRKDDDRFQIAGTAYQFRKSACFLKSAGKLECTTCHDPHEEKHGTQVNAQYNAVCSTCHAQPANHAGMIDCVTCHMPRRRTQDVVHVVMTDHYIRRQPLKGDLLADLAEDHGAPKPSHVGPSYPLDFQDPFYSAMARVRSGETAVSGARAQSPDAWFEIGEAEYRAGHLAKAIAAYRTCLALDSGYLAARLGLGNALVDAKQPAAGMALFLRAAEIAPTDPRTWNSLGQVQLQLEKSSDARKSFEKALSLDLSMPEPHNWLGILAAQSGNAAGAEEQFRAAIRLQPNYADAHTNLANLLALKDYSALAAVEFETAIAIKPGETGARMSYAGLLNQLRRFDAAKIQIEAALRIAPKLPDAHDLLGNLLEREGKAAQALKEYQEEVRLHPGSLRAQLDIGAALKNAGELAAAIPHLRRAASSPDPSLRSIAIQLLEESKVPQR